MFPTVFWQILQFLFCTPSERKDVKVSKHEIDDTLGDGDIHQTADFNDMVQT